MKLNNYVLMCHMTHSVAGGLATFGFKTFFGHKLEHFTVNYLGQQRGNYA